MLEHPTVPFPGTEELHPGAIETIRVNRIERISGFVLVMVEIVHFLKAMALSSAFFPGRARTIARRETVPPRISSQRASLPDHGDAAAARISATNQGIS